MEKFDPNSVEQSDWDRWGSGFYETGSTRPPKDHRSGLAVVLVLSILAVSMFSAIQLLRIPILLQLRQAQPTDPALIAPATQSFENLDLADSVVTQTSQRAESFRKLGLEGYRVPQVMQYMYHIPDGLYLTQVCADSDAARQGLHPGDVLLSVDETPVTDQETLDSLLQDYTPGQSVSVQVYSNHRSFQLQLIISE